MSGPDGAELLFKDRGEVAASWSDSETARTTSMGLLECVCVCVCASLDLYNLASGGSLSEFLQHAACKQLTRDAFAMKLLHWA